MARTVKSGFRLDVKQCVDKLARLKGQIKASQFKPELLQFVKRSCAIAARETPVRDLALIRQNQRRQYAHRINYIPSYHTLENPSLRVNGDKVWVYSNDKWYLATNYMPAEVWAQFQALNSERDRRMSTERGEFIAERAQARFLYKKSWYQVAESLGVPIRSAQSVATSHSRHNPPKEPDRGYGQLRGGERVLTCVIYNPFLSEESAYKEWDGADIIRNAMEVQRPVFNRAVDRKLKRICYAIFHASSS